MPAINAADAECRRRRGLACADSFVVVGIEKAIRTRIDVGQGLWPRYIQSISSPLLPNGHYATGWINGQLGKMQFGQIIQLVGISGSVATALAQSLSENGIVDICSLAALAKKYTSHRWPILFS